MSSRIHWPEARPEPDTGPGSYAAWLGRLSDEVLNLLDAVATLHDGKPWAPWAEPLLASIKAEGEAVPVRPNCHRPNTCTADDRSKLHEAADFGEALKMTWPGADWRTRDALRTIASVLGVAVPEEEPRPMRRTKRPKLEVQGPGRTADRQPIRPVVKVCPRPARAHSEPITALEPAEPEDDEPEDQHWIEGNERNWHPQGYFGWR